VSAISVDALVRHVRLYGGADDAFEVASYQLGPVELAQLAGRLTRLEADRGRRWRLAPARRHALVERLDAERIDTRRIAAWLDLDERSVQRIRAAVREVRDAPDHDPQGVYGGRVAATKRARTGHHPPWPVLSHPVPKIDTRQIEPAD
jgi:hypothetical protein